MVLLQGGVITRRPLAFTADGRCVCAPCGNDIRLYSARTGDHVATLRGHTAEVTAVAADAGSSTTVLSASMDGTLRQWDVAEGSNTQTWHIGAPIESMVFSRAAGLVYVAVHHRAGAAGRVIPYRLPSGPGGQPTEAPGKIKVSKPGPLILSPTGGHVATIDRNSLFVWAAGASTTGARAKPLNLPHTKNYTCAAFDPTDSIIAAGDVTGRILIWHDFPASLQQWAASAAGLPALGGDDEPAVQLPHCTTIHWHQRAVGALCFTPDGSAMLSGGAEGVLVRWALPNCSRNYLPRLGGPLKGILPSTTDPARFCIAHSDNTVRFVNLATMSVELSVHGLRQPPAAAALAAAGYGHACSGGASSPAGVLVHPGTGHLVLTAENATLQFYDMARDRHVARLSVCPHNPTLTYASQSVHGQPAGAPPQLQPSVVLVAFTGDGRSLITVDVRPTTVAYAGGAEEVTDTTVATIRFWDAASAAQLAAASQPYVLNTVADAPHRGVVTSLAAHPWQHLAATTGSEGELKLWTRRRGGYRPKEDAKGAADGAAGAAGAAPAPSQSSHWRCAAVGSHQDQPLAAAAFSPDGSLLAVAAGTAATLWDPTDGALLMPLCCPADATPSDTSTLRQLVFIRHSPHLVGLLGGDDGSAAAEALGLVSAAQSQAQAQAQLQPQAGGGGGKQQQQQQKRLVKAACQRQQRLLTRIAAGWGTAVVVWDLLSGGVVWYTSLPVCSLAADPAYPLFAVGVPVIVTPASAAEAAQQQAQEQQQGQGQQAQGQQALALGQGQQQGQGQGQQQGQAQQAQQSQQAQQAQQQSSVGAQGLVLVFAPLSAQPLYACPVPGSDPSSLVFMHRPGSQQQQPQLQQPQPVSPLLLLTSDRRYTRVALPSAAVGAADAPSSGAAAAAAGALAPPGAEVPSGTRAAMEAELAAAQDGVDAMFGRVEPRAAAQAVPGAPGGAAAAAEAAAVKVAVAQLFDAPSHVLPAPSALAPTLLELLVGVGFQR